MHTDGQKNLRLSAQIRVLNPVAEYFGKEHTMMERRERIARLVLLVIVVGLPVMTLGYQYWLRPAASATRIIDIRAAAPEAGGFQPDSIQVNAGETVTLRFYSVDVTHGIAIGPGLGIDLGAVDPGQVKAITLTFEQPGTYTFYCTSWCSADHWRMRGVIQVVDPANPNALPTPQIDPIIIALATAGVDIDAYLQPTGAAMTMPMPTPEFALPAQPSVARGAALIDGLVIPAELRDSAWRFAHTPAEALDALIAVNPAASLTDLVDAVAYLWVEAIDQTMLADTQRRYNSNCAPCHGQTGNGDGPAATQLTDYTPAVFADPARMFTRRSDVLYAKIRRGGMGTNMPNFGTLFTPAETEALVEYLWTLALPPTTGAPLP